MKSNNTIIKKLKIRFAHWLFITAVFIWTHPQSAEAQCIPPNVVGSQFCVNTPIQFKSGAKRVTNIIWDFGDGNTDSSGTEIPVYSYSKAGAYTVTQTYTDASGNPCSQTIKIVILPAPSISIDIITPDTQCFYGNLFTVVDNSTASAGSFIKRVKYAVAGKLFEDDNPQMPFSFDFSTSDPGGNFYNIDVETEDANGCIATKRFKDIVLVKPELGLKFTSIKPVGCDSTKMIVTNLSTINRNKVSSFRWDFGDGSFDTTNWDSQVEHTYYVEGPNNGAFKTCLTVTDKTACTETLCLDGSATNIKSNVWIESSKDSACISDQPIEFYLKPHYPTGATGFLWFFGDPDTGPYNVSDKDPVFAEHTFSKPGPFLITYQYFHPICGNREIQKQVALLGPNSYIPGPPLAIEERYQCEAKKIVNFLNESKFFHNDRKFEDDAFGYFDNTFGVEKWIYNFDSTNAFGPNITDEDDYLDNRGKDCVFRVWDFDDDYAPRCTTNTVLNYNVGMNCKYSLDSLPSHKYTDWDSIYYDSFYLKNEPFSKTIVVKDDPNNPDGCYKVRVDTTDAAEHRRLFYLEIPRCYNVKLFHKDTCHDYYCESQATTQISIMKPRATGVRKEGRYCFGGPPLYGVTFTLDGTQPGCSANEVYINRDTATNNINNPNSWWLFTPGGVAGKLPMPLPIMPYPMAGPYPNQFFLNYPFPEVIADKQTGYAHLGFIIGNGVGNNLCYDTAYYDSFIKFPIIDANVDILLPTKSIGNRTYKVCKGDPLVIQVNKANKTIPYDVDQINYSFQRIAPSDVEERGRFPFYNYSIFENYEWFVSEKDAYGNEILGNYLNREVIRTYGTKSDTLLKERFKVGTVEKFVKYADVSQIFDILEPAFDGLGFKLASMSEQEIADVIELGCIDTTDIGNLIDWNVLPLERTSIHFRDTSIFGLDTYLNNPADYEDNAYTIIAEENGLFNLVFNVRSRIGGCFSQSGYRVAVGFYNSLDVSDSIICKGTEIIGEPFFRYWHIDPENNIPSPCRMSAWLDCNDYWKNREGQAGQLGIEGHTKWDWSIADDDINNPQTIFAPNNSGNNPYGEFSYSPVTLGGSGSNAIYYRDSGIYTLRIAASDSTGCQDTLYQNIYVTEQFSNVKIEADKNTICSGDVVTFNITGDSDLSNIRWNFNANVNDLDTILAPETTQQHKFSDVGTRYISVQGLTNSNLVKCPNADTISIYVAPIPKGEVIVGDIITYKDSIRKYSTKAIPSHAYYWIVSSHGSIVKYHDSVSLDIKWKDEGIGKLSYIVQNAYMCVDTVNYLVQILKEDVANVINYLDESTQFLYPNPANDFLQLRFDNKISQVIVFDNKGSQVINIQPDSDKIDFRTLLPGLYFIQINDIEGNIFVGKVIKE